MSASCRPVLEHDGLSDTEDFCEHSKFIPNEDSHLVDFILLSESNLFHHRQLYQSRVERAFT